MILRTSIFKIGGMTAGVMLSVLLATGTTAAAAKTKPVNAKLARDLKIVVVDVEGGSATLFVTPEGKSLLIDAGWPPGMGGARRSPGAPPPLPAASSADKIVDAAHALGLKKIDYFILTHYHVDHAGGVKSLLDKIEVDNFIDHGPNAQPDEPNMPPARAMSSTAGLYASYMQLIQGKSHIVPKTGDTLDIGSLHLQFVSVANKVLSQALPGAGAPNPDCTGVPGMARDGGVENSYSVASILTFGKTRIAEFGDLPWNQEVQMLCPTNKVGPVDIYFVTGHGMDLSSSPPTRALDPIVTIMGNGATKGGDEAVMKTIYSYAHHDQAVWLLHDTIRYPDLNPDPNYIANLNWVPDLNFAISATISPDGAITVTNGRNGFSKTYKARNAR